jgi:hypothetical protein
MRLSYFDLGFQSEPVAAPAPLQPAGESPRDELARESLLSPDGGGGADVVGEAPRGPAQGAAEPWGRARPAGPPVPPAGSWGRARRWSKVILLLAVATVVAIVAVVGLSVVASEPHPEAVVDAPAVDALPPPVDATPPRRLDVPPTGLDDPRAAPVEVDAGARWGTAVGVVAAAALFFLAGLLMMSGLAGRWIPRQIGLELGAWLLLALGIFVRQNISVPELAWSPANLSWGGLALSLIVGAAVFPWAMRAVNRLRPAPGLEMLLIPFSFGFFLDLVALAAVTWVPTLI